ncbi:MAG: hypothetical protein FWD73_02685 [Polyangiaceae bacterium]|nr:hypothetical protein [Polyangiaceae bacterium]
MRHWAAFDPAVQAAVRAIDRRRLDYLEELLVKRGLTVTLSQMRAQILYWAFLGFALSSTQLPGARMQSLLDELLQMVSSARFQVD